LFFVRLILLPTTASHFHHMIQLPAEGAYRRLRSKARPSSRSVCSDGAAYHHARRLDLYAGPHGGGDGDAVDELALGALRLCLLHRIRESPDVFHELVGRK